MYVSNSIFKNPDRYHEYMDTYTHINCHLYIYIYIYLCLSDVDVHGYGYYLYVCIYISKFGHFYICMYKCMDIWRSVCMP